VREKAIKLKGKKDGKQLRMKEKREINKEGTSKRRKNVRYD
jgi:hypothetical protein